MPNFKLYILARAELQLESLNASGAVGNYTRLQEGYLVVNGEPIPVPVITGNALKNWHARAMAEKYVELMGRNVHDIHFTHMFRLPGDAVKGRAKDERGAERLLVSECAICDLHGLLIAEENVPQVKRESLVKFSFSVPIEEEVAKRLKFVTTHNRVVPAVEGMMIFKREYSSAVYAWEAAINLTSIGRSQYDKDANTNVWLGKKIVADNKERANRAKAAVLAFESLLTGSLGASTARALPISKPLEVVAVLVSGCVPVPYHPYYSDYKERLIAYINSYSEKVEKVCAMNVEIGKQPLEQLGQQAEKKVLNHFKDYYQLLDVLATEVYNKVAGEEEVRREAG